MDQSTKEVRRPGHHQAKSVEDNKRVVSEFVERCQNQHDLGDADRAFHPDFVNHYHPEGRTIVDTAGPASGFKGFYGALLSGFPDATMTVDDQLAERDVVATRKTFRGTHQGELWGIAPSGRRVEFEFIDIFRVADGLLIEHWTSMDLGALRGPDAATGLGARSRPPIADKRVRVRTGRVAEDAMVDSPVDSLRVPGATSDP